jgi:hypothetical protein
MKVRTSTLLGVAGVAAAALAAGSGVVAARVGAAEGATAQPTPAPIIHGLMGPASCPLTFKVGVYPFLNGPFPESQHMVNVAVALLPGADDPFQIYAGALGADATQGAVVVVRSENDPCADGARAAKNPALQQTYDRLYHHVQWYQSASHDGALAITQVQGTIVTYRAADGVTGHFNFLSGQFSR